MVLVGDGSVGWCCGLVCLIVWIVRLVFGE